MSVPLLHQFRFSHFNEKARWALDYKGVAHRRRSYLPGTHFVPVLLASRQKQVPVLRDGSTAIAGSAAIADYLERTHPQPPLYPATAELRQRALQVQERFDTLGAPLRAAFFHSMLDDPPYLARLFTAHAGPLVHRLYRAAFPAIAVAMRRDMQLNDEVAADGLARTADGLDFVAAHTGPDGYLVGDRFSIADLAAAAILAPTVLPTEFPYPCPTPHNRQLDEWLARWSTHPGAAWVREMYRRHRGTSAEV